MLIRISALAATVSMFTSFAANAALTVSDKPTKNVTCTNGVCSATAKHANLNTVDLTNMLADTDVSLSGAAGEDIVVANLFQWAATYHFAMTSSKGIQINAPITVTGTSGIAISTGGGSAPTFGTKGQIEFWDTASSLTINGAAFTLAADFPTLSDDIAKNPTGNFAWAKDYDAKSDGVYTQNPVTSILAGQFEGLGNTIKNLKIKSTVKGGAHVGLFYAVGAASDLHLAHVNVTAASGSSVGALAGLCAKAVTNVDVTGNVSAFFNSYVGGLCGALNNNMTGAHSSGKVTGREDRGTIQNAAGGLVGLLDGGVISNSYSSATVTGGNAWTAGGLVGTTENSVYRVTQSYATGVVSVGDNGVAGGLVGNNTGGQPIDNSYASGFILGGVNSIVGGLIGLNEGPVSDSYSSGPVESGSGNAVGGFIGTDHGASDLTDTYFDIDTSGQSHGVGNNTGYPGVTGLTTEQFQVGLPDGLDPSIWGENATINGGLPYLLALSPK
jgi:hypothetical protein